MRVLFLAPQPFFVERGTPIAIRLALDVLRKNIKKADDCLHFLSLNQGDDVELDNVRHYRSFTPAAFQLLPPGFTFRKALCDIFFFLKTIRLMIAGVRKKKPYTVIHAVEESVFIALFCKLVFKTPYIYDMDSSMASQLIEKWPVLKHVQSLLEFFEALAIKHAAAVLPVCRALEERAKKNGAAHTQLLSDISLHEVHAQEKAPSLREELKLSKDDTIILYVGNLEHYQGIDLLVESMVELKEHSAHLLIAGGSAEHIQSYKEKARDLGIETIVHLLGPRPLACLHDYLEQADILASPRTKGDNTPMKVYSYLHSGTPIVATKLPTHTQVMDDSVAVLTEPNKDEYAKGLKKLCEDKGFAKKIGEAAHTLAEEKYSLKEFEKNLLLVYQHLKQCN